MRAPEVIREYSGITVLGKRIKSLVFSTDVAKKCQCRCGDCRLSVHTSACNHTCDSAGFGFPVFVGVGGGLTKGQRVISLAEFAEMQGAIGVVLNAPTSDDVVEQVSQAVNIPTVITVVHEDEDIDARVAAGASILNVSGASKTADIVRKIRQKYHDVPIIATGGPTEESIRKTIEAGANAITWTPPSNAEIFKTVMAAYRKGESHP